MRHLVAVLVTLMFCLSVSTTGILAQEGNLAQDDFYQAKILQVSDEGQRSIEGYVNPYQIVEVEFISGDKIGDRQTISHGTELTIDKSLLVNVGETVVVLKSTDFNGEPFYQIVDKYRLDKVISVIFIFFLAIILLSRLQGFGSVLGMVLSLLVITKFIVPEIIAGNDPLVISIVGCFIIMFLSIYLAHGFSKKTTIALVSTFLTLTFIGLISVFLVGFTKLTGISSEEAYSIRLGPLGPINFKGLLLGGILIGALGVLDDITTGLTASVFELSVANPKYNLRQLYYSALNIGKEHIASLVNTLVLAYAGAGLPIFLLLVMNPAGYPLWAVLNSEPLIEEVIRTLAGSFGLLLAVPLTTFLSAYYVTKVQKS